MRRGYQRNPFRQRKTDTYLRCPRCGGKFIERLMRKVGKKLICGPCYLIDYVWKQ